MNKESVFNTVAMAKIHAKQGYLDQAAEIYRYLLKQEPDRQDLNDALIEIEREKTVSVKETNADKRNENLVSLFDQWFELIFKYKKYKQLKNLLG